MTHTSSFLEKIAFALTLIGAVNWGLVGAMHFDLVHFLLGTVPVLQNTVYSLVGISGLYLIITSVMRMSGAANNIAAVKDENNARAL